MFKTSRIPFADRKGLAVWPNGARMAVLVYTAPEQWARDSPESIRPAGTFAAGRGAPSSLSTRSAVAYGFNVGLHRLAEVFADFDMKVSLFTSGTSVEQYPEVFAELAAAGHELAGHGYSQGSVMAALDRPAKAEVIAKAAALLESAAGTRPSGWISPAAESDEDTIELLAEAGFDYHGDLQDDELPYFVHVGEQTLVEIPYRLVGNLNDLSLTTRNVNSVSKASAHLTDAFDAYYAAAAVRPLVFNYGTHPYISGRPDNAAILRALLEHIHRHEDVWVTSYRDLAQWWRQSFAHRIDAERGVVAAG